MTFEEARALFPVLDRVAYLNAGTFGPLAASTARAMAAAAERDLAEGRSGLEYFEHVLALRARVREALARLVGAPPEQLALTTSTTDGCNLVVAGLGLSSGDEVVTTTDEHPGLLLPLGVSQARVVVVPPDPDAILAAVTPRTRLIALSQVLWTTGQVLPVAELRTASGVPVLVDGAQSVGAIPVDASGVDFLTISGQKWLRGPDSTGAVVVADPERLGVAWPSYFSQVAAEPDGAFAPHPDARRFEGGWWAPSVAAGLLDALAVRPPWWHERASATAERCRALLGARHEVVLPAERSTLVAFRPSGEAPADVVARLHRRDVHVREIPGTGLVRVSCGWWTSDDDLDRLVAELG